MAKSKKSGKPDEKIVSPEPSPEVRPIPLALKPELGLLRAPVRLKNLEPTAMSAWDDVFMPKAEVNAAHNDAQAFFELMGAVLGIKEKSLRRSASMKMPPYGFAINVEATGEKWLYALPPEDEQSKTERLEAEFEVLLANHNRLMDHFK
jgi:hypothetical protein